MLKDYVRTTNLLQILIYKDWNYCQRMAGSNLLVGSEERNYLSPLNLFRNQEMQFFYHSDFYIIPRFFINFFQDKTWRLNVSMNYELCPLLEYSRIKNINQLRYCHHNIVKFIFLVLKMKLKTLSQNHVHSLTKWLFF